MKTVYNPDSEDFTFKYDIDGNGNPKSFIIRAFDYVELEDYLADHAIKHLANKLLDKRGMNLNPEADLVAIKKEITEVI